MAEHPLSHPHRPGGQAPCAIRSPRSPMLVAALWPLVRTPGIGTPFPPFSGRHDLLAFITCLARTPRRSALRILVGGGGGALPSPGGAGARPSGVRLPWAGRLLHERRAAQGALLALSVRAPAALLHAAAGRITPAIFMPKPAWRSRDPGRRRQCAHGISRRLRAFLWRASPHLRPPGASWRRWRP